MGNLLLIVILVLIILIVIRILFKPRFLKPFDVYKIDPVRKYEINTDEVMLELKDGQLTRSLLEDLLRKRFIVYYAKGNDFVIVGSNLQITLEEAKKMLSRICENYNCTVSDRLRKIDSTMNGFPVELFGNVDDMIDLFCKIEDYFPGFRVVEKSVVDNEYKPFTCFMDYYAYVEVYRKPVYWICENLPEFLCPKKKLLKLMNKLKPKIQERLSIEQELIKSNQLPTKLMFSFTVELSEENFEEDYARAENILLDKILNDYNIKTYFITM